MREGALGCTISGAGPTVVAIATDLEAGKKIANGMVAAFKEAGKLQVNYAGVAQLCASGAREYAPEDAKAAAHGSFRIV